MNIEKRTRGEKEEMEEKKIREIVDEANGLSKKGENEEALQLLRGCWDETESLPFSVRKDPLRGLICHYRGRVLQTMGKYEQAVEELQEAEGYRQDNPVDYAYTAFQLFICKEYGKLPISDEEVEATKFVLLEGIVDKAATIADIGNFLQNVAYIEQVKGDTEKAILFYDMTLASREMAHDERGRALTYARLAECHKEVGGEDEFAKMYAQRALEYFENTGDKERIEQVKKVLREI